MKNVLLYCFCFLLSVPVFAQKKLHKYSFKTPDEMFSFFEYSPEKKIISGHRGTIENGLPENSIASMKQVLKNTYAIFEVDPRLSKDSVAVMLHDPGLKRTTNGTGKVNDFTYRELKKLRLRNKNGDVTKYKVNTLEEMIKWAKGKTVLNLDHKDLPFKMTAEIIRKHNAYAWVWVTVHNVEQARFYLDENPNQFLSMHIKTKDDLEKFIKSGLPFNRMIVYIGSQMKESNQEMYQYLNKKGVMCMISSAPTYDKIDSVQERAEKYRAIFEEGASILESDLPIEVGNAIR